MRSQSRLKNKAIILLLTIGVIAFALLSSKVAWTQTAKYKLQPSDVLTITVHGQPDLTTKTRVALEGYITFPLLGKVSVEALTLQELEAKIKILLEKDYLVSAQVLAFIEEYHLRQVSVIGEVNLPGKYDIPEEGELTLIEAIALAGGFTKDALIKKIKIIRAANGVKEIINIDAREISLKDQEEMNIALEPEDIIIVPESFF